METTIYGNSAAAWGWALAASLAMWLVFATARRIVFARLSVWADRTRNRTDDLVAEVVGGTRNWFIIVAAARLGSEWVALPAGAARLLHIALLVALIVQASLWGNLLITHLLQRRAGRDAADEAGNAAMLGAVAFVLRLVLWSFLVLVGLDNLGIDITALIAGLGVGGVAVALAVQNILGDLFASLSIVFDKPFEPGDFIIVGDSLGTVEHVGLKTTRVRSLHGEQIVFSNTDLLASRIRNFKRMHERRVVFTLGVTYDTPREKLARIPLLVATVIEALPDVRFDRAHFKAFGAFSLDFEIVYYVLDPDYNRYMDVQQMINLDIVQAFEAERIEFAFPTQTLHVDLAKAPTNRVAATQVSL